jgi:hypothetical protein
LSAALWAFHRSDSFREGALRAVNMGDDADTTGAIYGQLAGAYYSLNAIPKDWIERLALHELINEAGYDLCHVSLSLEFHSESEQRPDARAAAEPAGRHRNQNGTEHCSSQAGKRLPDSS